MENHQHIQYSRLKRRGRASRAWACLDSRSLVAPPGDSGPGWNDSTKWSKVPNSDHMDASIPMPQHEHSGCLDVQPVPPPGELLPNNDVLDSGPLAPSYENMASFVNNVPQRQQRRIEDVFHAC